MSESDRPDAVNTALGEARYRIGNVVLALTSDDEALLRELHDAYGDCAIEYEPAAVRTLAVDARLSGRSLKFCFSGAGPVDLLEAAGAPFRLLRVRQNYVEKPGPIDGWRSLVNTLAGDRLLMTAKGPLAEIDLDEAPAEFITDFLVGVAQRAQPDTFFFHSASVAVQGQGALMTAAGRGGKSTMALAMAMRGHQFLGDDIAAVTREARTVLPFPKSVGLREGPMARTLAPRVAVSPYAEATGPDGIPRILIRASDLFPGCLGNPVPLRCVFFLDGFAPEARAEPFDLSLRDVGLLRSTVSEATPSWGRSTGRDLMQFLALVNLLGQARCYRVKLSTPEASAVLLERLVEETCISM